MSINTFENKKNKGKTNTFRREYFLGEWSKAANYFGLITNEFVHM